MPHSPATEPLHTIACGRCQKPAVLVLAGRKRFVGCRDRCGWTTSTVEALRTADWLAHMIRCRTEDWKGADLPPLLPDLRWLEPIVRETFVELLEQAQEDDSEEGAQRHDQ